jgi:hypothetical protein
MAHTHAPFFLYVGVSAKVVSTLLMFVVTWFSALFINRITQGHFQTIFDPALFWLVIAYVTLPFVSMQLDNLYAYLWGQFYNFFTQYMEIECLRVQLRTDIQTQEDSLFADLKEKAHENLFRVFHFTQSLVALIQNSIITTTVSVIILGSYSIVLAFLIIVAFIPELVAQVVSGKRIWAIWGARTDLRRKYSTYTEYFASVPSLTEMKVLQSGEHWIGLIRGVLDIFNSELRDNELRRFYLQLGATTAMIVMVGVVTFLLMSKVVIGILAVGTFLFLESQILAVRRQISEAVFFTQ